MPGVRQFVYITGSMTGLQSSTQSRSTKAWSSLQSGVTTPLPRRRMVSILPTSHRGPSLLALPLLPERRMVTLPIKYTNITKPLILLTPSDHGEPSPFKFLHMRFVCNLISSCGESFTPKYTNTTSPSWENCWHPISTSHVESLYFLLPTYNTQP